MTEKTYLRTRTVLVALGTVILLGLTYLPILFGLKWLGLSEFWINIGVFLMALTHAVGGATFAQKWSRRAVDRVLPRLIQPDLPENADP